MPVKVIAFDPGGTTGFVRTEVHLDTPGLPTCELCGAAEITTFQEFNDVFLHVPVDVVLVESFNLRPDKAQAQIGSNFPSAEWIGIIKYFCWSYQIVKPVFQTPAEKERIPNQMLKERFGLVNLPSSLHIRDAMRHVVFWALEKRYGK